MHTRMRMHMHMHMYMHMYMYKLYEIRSYICTCTVVYMCVINPLLAHQKDEL